MVEPVKVASHRTKNFETLIFKRYGAW